MTQSTGPARQHIVDTATANGWAMFATSDRSHGYRRGDVWVSVSFMDKGTVREATRSVRGDLDPTYAPLRGKRETVIGWLTETPAASADLDDTPTEPTKENDMKPTYGELSAHLVELTQELNTAGAERDRLAAANRRLVQHGRVARIVELEAENGRIRKVNDTMRNDYRAARERITELEDQPLRSTARRVIEGIRRQREDGPVEVSPVVAKALADLADLVGEPLGFATAEAPHPGLGTQY